MNQNVRQHRILSYADMKAATVGDSKEPLVSVSKYDATIVAQHDNDEMEQFTGDDILVRDTLARKLAKINARLRADDLRLKVVFGYRHPKVQELYFKQERQKLRLQNPDLSDDELDALTHLFVAVPDVAGHPMGAALDLTLIQGDGQELDMGTKISDFSAADKLATFAEGLSKSQIKNRRLLHDAMLAENFAPFYGEWWHFSYGDREWAAFYGLGQAIYGKIDL